MREKQKSEVSLQARPSSQPTHDVSGSSIYTVDPVYKAGFCMRYLSGLSPIGKLNAPGSIIWD